MYSYLNSSPNTETTMTQRALLLEEVGKPLILGHGPIPQPPENQLLVKVLVAGRKFGEYFSREDEKSAKYYLVNPHDQRTRDFGLFVTSMPYVLASDLVGEVVTVGPGEYSAKFTLGEHVFGHTFAEGGFHNDFNAAQQYALVDARYVGRVADSGLSDDEASTIPVIALGGFIALFASSGLVCPLLSRPRQRILTIPASLFMSLEVAPTQDEPSLSLQNWQE